MYTASQYTEPCSIELPINRVYLPVTVGEAVGKKVWIISDTHEMHDSLVAPDGVDAVIHCGDEANSSDPVKNLPASMRFFEWFKSLPIPRKIFVPGNHSTAISRNWVYPEQFPEIEFLIHDETTMFGLSVFGSPWAPSMPWENPWVFTKKRDKMHGVWESISLIAVNILVTHGPAKGCLDITRDKSGSKRLVQVGCASLKKWLAREVPKPMMHAFGHIHDEDGVDNYGAISRDGLLSVNAAVCDARYNIRHGGHVIEFTNCN